MDIARVLLIGINACVEVEDPNVPLEDLANGHPLITCLPDGFPMSRRPLRRFKGSLPEPWTKIIRSVSVDSFTSVNNYTAWLSVAELEPSALSELFTSDEVFSRSLDKLHDAAFAGACKRDIDTRRGDNSLSKYPYILYLEPLSPLALPNDEETQKIVKQLYVVLGRPDEWVVPRDFLASCWLAAVDGLCRPKRSSH